MRKITNPPQARCLRRPAGTAAFFLDRLEIDGEPGFNCVNSCTIGLHLCFVGGCREFLLLLLIFGSDGALRLRSEAVVARIGPIWGFGEGQDLRNMYTRTAQPGLWFIAGSLAQCRINSKYLALQIKAIEEGLLPHVARPAKPDAAVA